MIKDLSFIFAKNIISGQNWRKAMFNLKKAQVKSYDKMLQDMNKKDGLEPLGETGNYNWLLKDVRKNPDGDRIIEKQLKEVRTGDVDQVITDKAIDNNTDSYIQMRHKKPAPPLMDYAKDFGTASADLEIYKKAEDKPKDRDTEFWDKFVGEQLIDREPIKIVNNVQPSQLVNQFKTREDFIKENPSMKSSAVKDASAILYHIYRTASEQNRELSLIEKQMVVDVKSSVARIFASTEDNKAEDEYRQDTSDIVGDDIEKEIKDREDSEFCPRCEGKLDSSGYCKHCQM